MMNVQESWEMHGLSALLGPPQLFFKGHLHHIYLVHTLDGDFVLKHWLRCGQQDFFGHISKISLASALLHEKKPELVSEHCLLVPGDKAVWTYSNRIFGHCIQTDKLSDWHIDQIVAAMVLVHQHTASLPDIQPIPWCTFEDMMAYRDRGLLPNISCDSIDKNWFDLVEALGKDDLVFCHYDLQSRNFLWSEDRLVGLIDWECSAVVDRTLAVTNAALSCSVFDCQIDFKRWQYFWQVYQRHHSINREKIALAIETVLVEWLSWALCVDQHAHSVSEGAGGEESSGVAGLESTEKLVQTEQAGAAQLSKQKRSDVLCETFSTVSVINQSIQKLVGLVQ